MTTTRRRPGLSLTEVLVAMFITALGLIALFTLFPLGAIQVAQALKDDRTAQTAGQADAYVRQFWRHQVVAPLKGNGQPDSSVWALDDPNLLVRRPDTGTTGGHPFPNVYEVFYAGVYSNPSLSPRRQLPVGAAILPPSATTTNQMRASTVGLFTDLYPAKATGTGEVSTTFPPDCFYTPNPLSQGYATSGYVDGGGTARTDVPSFPVLLDGVGFLGRSAPERLWVAGGAGGSKDLEGMQPGSPVRETIFGVRQFIPPGVPSQPGDLLGTLVPRRKPDLFDARFGQNSLNQSLSVFGLTDDLTFQANGSPNSNLLGRQGRYTWAAMIQRPHNNFPTAAKFWVLVFDGRPASSIPAREEVVLANTFVNLGTPRASATLRDASNNPAPVLVDIGDASITLTVPARGAEQSPLVRRGGWVMLANLDPNPNGTRRAISFHRIVGVTEGDAADVPVYPGAGTNVSATPFQLDLDPPVPAETASYIVTQGSPPVMSHPQVYLFGGLTEVFARPDLAPDPTN